MAQKHLHELLKEDQEPFLLKSYIADKRVQLKRAPRQPRTQLQVKNRRPISSEVSNFPRNLCKNACFFSLQDSPDLRKSPLFDFSSSAAKSPCKSPNAIFLQIPTRTAALLVEAAMRIQKQSTNSKPKTQNNSKNHGFGLLGSFLKRLKTNRSRTQKREIEANGVKVSTEETQMKTTEDRFESAGLSMENQSTCEISATCETCFSSNCNSRLSSAVWSLDVDTSSSSQSDYSEALMGTDCVCCDKKRFCESPFRFVLDTTSPSPSGSRTPDFTSPATSPARHKQQEDEGLENFHVGEEEEDKEQCSPVSVLDPPFEDDDDEEGHCNENEQDGFDMECSYAIMQRTKKQLMQKLSRFEKLAELDPVELEKRMLEEEEEEEEDDDDDDDAEDYDSIGDLEEESEESDDDESKASESNRADNLDGFVREALCKLSFPSMKRIPEDVKRLVSDLIIEEDRKEDDGLENKEEVVRRVCKRFNSWKEVELNTIDMMVEQDFRKELDGWKKNQDQVGETAVEIELAIFGLLVEEFAMELVYTGN